jgi:sulfite exporter TauE/SafE
MFYIKLIAFLVQGFVVGAGPCLFVCAPILLPYLAGTRRTWQEGLKATLIFGLTRLMIYSLLGGVVGYVGYYIFKFAFYNRIWGKYLWTFAGSFIILLGILIILGKWMKNPLCRFLQKHALENSAGSMVILGIVIGLSPCLPLLAILTEVMFLAKDFFQGFFYGFAFGIGTVISPLLLLGALAPLIPAKLFKSELASRIFSIICGILLILIGIYIIQLRGVA